MQTCLGAATVNANPSIPVTNAFKSRPISVSFLIRTSLKEYHSQAGSTIQKPNKSMQKIKVCRISKYAEDQSMQKIRIYRRSKYAEDQSVQKRILKRARSLLGSLSTAQDLPKAILPALPTPSTLPCL